MDIGRLVATLGLNTAPFTAGMAQAQKQMKTANAAMAASGAKMAAIGKTLSRNITLPLVAAGAASVSLASNFEASMAKITGLVGVAKDQVEAWKKEVLALGPATGQGPDKLADALFFITSAGLRGAEAMDVLKMSAKAATSGLGETKVVADLVTSAMNAYGKENLSASQATDILVASVKEGKAEADELAGAMGAVIPISSAFGVSFNEVGATFAAMTRTGTSARVAATQLKAILSSMASPSQDAEEAMAKYGTSAAKFKSIIREKGLITAMLSLREATKGNSSAMAEMFPNVRGLMGMLDLLGENVEDNVKIFKALENPTGALDAAFASASDTIKFKFQKAMATLKTTGIAFGTVLSGTLIPVIEKFTKILADATKWWNNLSEAQQKTRITVLALTAAVGPLLMIVGKLTTLIAANPYVALAAALIAATAATINFVKSNKELFNSYDAVASATKRIKKLYNEQAAEVRSLVNVIETENLSNRTRIAAIEKLKAIMPEYNGYLSEEGELIGHNVDVVKKYLDALKEKIKMQVYEEKYTETLKKQLKVGDKLAKAYAFQAAAMATGKGVVVATNRVLRLQKQYNNTTKAIEELDKKAGELNITLGGLGGESADATAPVVSGDLSGQQEEGSGSGESELPVLERLAAASVTASEGLAVMNEHLAITQDSLNNFVALDFEPTTTSLLTIGEIFNANAAAAFLLTDAVIGVGNAVGKMISKQAGAMKEFFGSIIDGVSRVLNALLAEAIAGVIAKEVSSKGLVGLATAVAGVAALKVVWDKFVPAFAEGGIVTGPTLGMMGEYPGARSNPEVIAPLNKLQQYIQPNNGPAGMPQEIILTAKGRDLKGVIRTQDLLDNTY